MPCKQFLNTISGIVRSKHINSAKGIAKHLQWQARKLLNLFPFEQQISESRIIAHHKRCGVSALINCRGMYDYNNMNLLKLLLQPGGTFFDIGANIGSYTLVASEQKAAMVFAFEPHPATFRLLKENVALAGRNNVVTCNAAVGSREEHILFTDEFGSSLNHRVNSYDANKKLIEVECLRIDSFCQTRGVLPRIVKIDVEGFEYDVLSGFGESLLAVDVLYIEINGMSDSRSKGEKDIIKMLGDTGMTGPYNFDFETMTFQKNASTTEDSIFLSARFCRQNAEHGFRVFD